ncbi:hypothetical protein NHH03_20295 [Stieleria sp. TO1_6]|uniref:hypothetical protein n=1 Tax=Stieleria tagensis TaxID=2956795 RepID=UPI00209A76D0|nr:hypothetical protein [Stieleria tagensis]MCO8124096.1 hypothetical protein [Stieleria tagensis]
MNSDSAPPLSHTRSSTWSWMIKGTIIGVVSVHLVLLIFAWIKGAIWGSSGDPSGLFPGSTGRAVEHGWTGGMNSAIELLALYAFSLGVIPLFLSILGAIAGFVICSSLRWRQAADSIEDPFVTTGKISIVRSILVYAAAAYTTAALTWGLTFESIGPMGWTGSLLWPLQVLNIAIWGTSAIAAYIRYRHWQIAAGVVAIGVSLYLLHSYYFLPPFGLLLGAILLLAYVVATSKRRSSTTVPIASTPENETFQTAAIKPIGANGFTVFLLGGFGYYAVVCLLTLLAVMRNQNPDNWGVVMPIVIGIWGIPIFGTVAATLHARAGSWAWLSNRRAWLFAACAFLICLLLLVAVLAQ